MTSWVVRPADVADAAGMGRVSVAAWRKAYVGMMRDEALARLSVDVRTRSWQERLADLQTPVSNFVIEQLGAIVGFASVGACRDDDVDRVRVGELWAIYVDPILWGKGAGFALWQRCLAEARVRGHGQLVLWVLTANRRARTFYEKQGMSPDGAEKSPLEDGEPLPHIRYRMTLITP